MWLEKKLLPGLSAQQLQLAAGHHFVLLVAVHVADADVQHLGEVDGLLPHRRRAGRAVLDVVVRWQASGWIRVDPRVRPVQHPGHQRRPHGERWRDKTRQARQLLPHLGHRGCQVS
jgi:hypothetical protein